MSAAAGAPTQGEVSLRVATLLERFLARRRAEMAAIDPVLIPMVDELLAVVGSGGKRVRPWLVVWGHLAAGGRFEGPIVTAGAAVELVHTFALLQDDFMDASATRRGRVATHVAMGASAAILISDLALVWADQLLCESGFASDALLAGMRLFNSLRSDVTLGQYLDVTAVADEDRALRVNRLKTASYTVLRPIQLGMVLAGAPESLLAKVPAYAEPAGIAFQLRDDELGAFGEASVTGKPAGDDLIRGKATWLWARALRSGPPPEGLEPLRRWIRESGSLEDAEALITRLESAALAALAELPIDAGLRAELGAFTRDLVDRHL